MKININVIFNDYYRDYDVKTVPCVFPPKLPFQNIECGIIKNTSHSSNSTVSFVHIQLTMEQILKSMHLCMMLEDLICVIFVMCCPNSLSVELYKIGQ
nr:uncharacterized protein LOC107450549 [Parasteatoda tepidariorum]